MIYCEAESKPSGWADDWNGSCAVVWDGRYIRNIDIQTEGEEVCFAFTPTESRIYTIESSGDYDTYGHLYNSSKSQIASDDDSAGIGNNFRISYYLEAGEIYYIGVRMYSNSATGSFTVTIS